LAALTLGVSLGAAAPAAVAQTASLTGETLESQAAVPGHETTFGEGFVCDKDETTTFTYTTTGTAGGPYVGTFVETGTITIGPQTNTDIDSRGVGAILAFSATFTIDSMFPPATVSGSKSLVSTTPPIEPTLDRFGRCEPDGGEPPTAVFALISTANVLYEATIDAPTGTRSDSGNAGLFIEASSVPGTTTFLESFTSTEPVPPPDECDEDEQGDDDDQGDDDCQGEDDDEQLAP
jgi:hypothetical protein